MPEPVTLKQKLASSMIPAVRLAMQSAPGLRQSIWNNVVKGRLDWRPLEFVARAHFGATFAVNLADVIQRYIYYFGYWEPQVEAVIAQSLRPGDCFVDVGANIGYFSLLAAHKVGPTGHVYAFEASRRTFAKLQANIERNRLSAILQAVHAAVADQEGVLTLYAGPEDNSGMSSLLRNEGGSEESVQAKPLGKLLAPESLRSARLIKIDVEGAEEMVVAGLEPDLGSISADILMELSPALLSDSRATHDAAARPASMPHVLAAFEQSGRKAYEILPPDSLANYFHAPLPARVRALSGLPEQRCDVLFSRRSAAELRSIGIDCRDSV